MQYRLWISFNDGSAIPVPFQTLDDMVEGYKVWRDDIVQGKQGISGCWIAAVPNGGLVSGEDDASVAA